MGGATDRRLLLLDEADNVVVAVARLRVGETILVEGDGVVMAADLPIGHKLARRAISSRRKDRQIRRADRFGGGEHQSRRARPRS